MALPDPLAVDAVVVNDPSTRTLTVRPAEQRGYGAVLWRQAHREFLEDRSSAVTATHRLLCRHIPPAAVMLLRVRLLSMGR